MSIEIDDQRVILVDDSPDFVESLSKILKLDEIDIKIFTKPEEFLIYSELEIFNKCKVLIVDYTMPKLTGYMVYKELYEIMGNNIPFKMILFTANIEQIRKDEKDFLKRIGVELLKKPNIKILINKILEGAA
jgi:FixJ family two-component response regulator